MEKTEKYNIARAPFEKEMKERFSVFNR